MSSMTGCCTSGPPAEPKPRKARLAREKRERCYGAIGRLFQGAVIAFAICGAAEAESLRLIAFGDSLSAGYQLPADASFPAQLEKRLRADGFDVALVNASVSGDTTSGGLARLGFALQDRADLVILELGANDMLRGVAPALTRANLEKMIAQIRAAGARALLGGMVANANFGPDYKREFDAIYPDLARRLAAPLYPFFLEGVAGDRSKTLPDGLHPNRTGVASIVEGIAPLVEKSIAELRADRGTPDAKR
jgi:acyl-CoA thioesterase I